MNPHGKNNDNPQGFNGPSLWDSGSSRNWVCGYLGSSLGSYVCDSLNFISYSLYRWEEPYEGAKSAKK